MGKIVVVTGGRNWANADFVEEHLGIFHSHHGIAELYEGGARGWDFFCRQWANAAGVQVTTIWPNWQGQGRAAGAMRNALMLERAKPHWLIAGPGGRGTADMLNRAKQQGLSIWICD